MKIGIVECSMLKVEIFLSKCRFIAPLPSSWGIHNNSHQLSYESTTKLSSDMQNMVIIIIKSIGDTFPSISLMVPEFYRRLVTCKESQALIRDNLYHSDTTMMGLIVRFQQQPSQVAIPLRRI
ncbi:hypothetical protein VNO77_13970 [Canavalia gladiata]|uniref:Uncharacterized protein n=1 Tax=Canavalia gladiata TaxID=3824 RepID=A0AAN9M2A7_CANGL